MLQLATVEVLNEVVHTWLKNNTNSLGVGRYGLPVSYDPGDFLFFELLPVFAE